MGGRWALEILGMEIMIQDVLTTPGVEHTVVYWHNSSYSNAHTNILGHKTYSHKVTPTATPPVLFFVCSEFAQPTSIRLSEYMVLMYYAIHSTASLHLSVHTLGSTFSKMHSFSEL